MEPRSLARLASARQKKHAGIQNLIRDLNRLYRALPALHELDCDPAGFEWVITDDAGGNVFAWIRKGNDARARCLVVVNFSPNVYHDYRVRRAVRRQVARGSQFGLRALRRQQCRQHRRGPDLDGLVPELNLTIPPLGRIFLVPEADACDCPPERPHASAQAGTAGAPILRCFPPTRKRSSSACSTARAAANSNASNCPSAARMSGTAI
jgi:hypothetical protein